MRPLARPQPAGPGGSGVPRHVAIIMDGNGRWAARRLLPRLAGHRAGVEAVRRVTRAARELGIDTLTLYAFSSENWRRPEQEVRDLMGLLKRFIADELEDLASENVRLKIIGDYRRFSPDVAREVERAVARTATNTGSTLVIALNYGSQAEIARAARTLAERVAAGAIAPENVDEAAIEDLLETRGLPPLDLLVRTSGEQRLSNFLLWQAAYAELVFTDTLWPDFDRAGLEAALAQFAGRQRRFGGL